MNDLIQTPNLGPVSFQKHVKSYFMIELAFGDIASATEQVIGILQSQEIERLVTPITLLGLEFWIHKSSSLVFTVLLEDGYKVVSMVVKADMSNFIFHS